MLASCRLTALKGSLPRSGFTSYSTKMTEASAIPFASDAKIEEFQRYLASSDRILALLGAGLSASSGLPTFRGAGGMWKNHQATSLATPQAFRHDPGLVWQFYSYRRHMALQAKPNPAHYALAQLAKKKPNFITLSQNVDGLSPRAGHPPNQLHLLHGNLFDIKCFNSKCNYFEANNVNDPIVPALAANDKEPEPSATDKTGAEATSSLYSAMGIKADASLRSRINMLDPFLKDETVPKDLLPHCPNCKTQLLRPGVVWFGENLDENMMNSIDTWIEQSAKIDLMLVIGTTAEVFPAAGYIDKARRKGARVAVVNMESGFLGATGSLRGGDWMFEGDAGVIVPKIFETVIGDMEAVVEKADQINSRNEGEGH